MMYIAYLRSKTVPWIPSSIKDRTSLRSRRFAIHDDTRRVYQVWSEGRESVACIVGSG